MDKEYGGICINLPPVLNIDITNRMTQIKELFFMGHNIFDPRVRTYYYRSLLIGRDQLPVWKKIALYHKTLLENMDRNISYHWEYGSVLPHNQSIKEEHKKMGVWDMRDNTVGKVFYTAPAYKIQLDGQPGDPVYTLNISTYGNKLDDITEERDGAGKIVDRYPTYSAEAIIDLILTNSSKPYTKQLSNTYVLKPPFAVGLQSNSFFFNTDILDFDTKDTCSITFHNCHIEYDSKTFYSGDKKYEGAVDNVIIDLNKNTKESEPNDKTKQGILTLMSSGNTSKPFTTYNGVLNQDIPYTKLCIKGQNQPSIGSGDTEQVRIDMSKFKYGSQIQPTNDLPNALEDIKRFISAISNWYNAAQLVDGKGKITKINSLYKIPQVK